MSERLRWAVFDVDGTILPNTSMERLLIRELIRNGLIPVRSFFVFSCIALKSLCRRGGVRAFLRNKQYFKGLPEKSMARFAKRLVDEKVVPRIPVAVLLEMNRLRKKGYRILLMSGAPEFLLAPLAERMGADAAMGTVYEVVEGRFAGGPCGDHLYGSAKARILGRRKKELEMDFRRSVVYANDASDAEHMRMFGTAVAVNPRKGLRRAAGEQGWRVVRW
jgi:HAD superfamily hydrolase (TIGR01490 family)